MICFDEVEKPKLTPLGAVTRKYRLDKSILLLDMASDLGITPADLCNIEFGKKIATPELLEKINNYMVST